MYHCLSRWLSGKEPTFAGEAGDDSLIPGIRSTPGEAKSNSFQYFCLENPMERGAW